MCPRKPPGCCPPPPPLVSGPCGCSALGLGLARQKCSPKSQVNRGGGRGRSPVQRAVDRPRGRWGASRSPRPVPVRSRGAAPSAAPLEGSSLDQHAGHPAAVGGSEEAASALEQHQPPPPRRRRPHRPIATSGRRLRESAAPPPRPPPRHRHRHRRHCR